MKVYQNIEESDYPDKDTLKRVIEDLIPLRKDKEATGDYYDKYLNSNHRREVFQYKHFASDGIFKGNGFVLNDGEIPPDEVIKFKDELLKVIRDDKESFGYIYRLLGQEINRRRKCIYVDDCLIPDDEIKYCIDFDVDELSKQIDGENDLHKIFRLIEDKRSESKKSFYKGNKKTIFEDYCESKINAIRNEIDIFGKQQNMNDLPSTEKTEQIRVYPAELDTDKARALFKKAIKKGFMNEDFSFNGTKYQMAYFAEIAAEKLNLKYTWKPFETLWGVKYLAQTRRESKEYIGKVEQQKDIDSIFT
jgi:hypothetical protein